MYFQLLFLFILKLISSVSCEANLHIIKKVEKNFTPLNSPGARLYSVEEKVGTHFSLLCELVFSQNETGYDGHISWIKKSNKFNTTVDFDQLSDKNLDDLYDSLKPSELNKAEKKFAPLNLNDNGSYICFTIKYKKYITLDLLVRSDERITYDRTSVIRENIFCSDFMFKCLSNGVCIIPHYVCDGKPDCKDGSDENIEKCNGDPCKDKLKCEDGRCIPTAWCCDRHHDANCTVTNRPECCQILAETYEELEYGVPNLTVNHNPHSTSTKYLFISICILSILFSLVILLLILSKVMIFAKKTAEQQRNGPTDIAYYHRVVPGSRNGNRNNDVPDQTMPMCHIPYVYGYRHSSRSRGNDGFFRTIIDDEVTTQDPLLNIDGRFLDRPPAYGEFNDGETVRFSEPPPPYTSREVLNDGQL